MGVIMQSFFWDCPHEDSKEFQWWNYVRQQIPSMAKVGFTSLWLPPVHKAANLAGPSMIIMISASSTRREQFQHGLERGQSWIS